MNVAALVTWILTILAGLFLLAIWLIEYDHDFQHAAATRLPVPVISAHALLAITGLVVWVSYLLLDSTRLAWTAVIIVLAGATLGLVMAFRWIDVYRTFSSKRSGLTQRGAAPAVAAGTGARRTGAGPDLPHSLPPAPPERNFPLPVVVAHGAFALATVTLVVLTAAGIGGS